MSTKKKDYLNFDRGPNWESPREREWRLQEEADALALAEEERRKRIEDAARLKAPAPYNPEQEERIRKEKAAASLDSFGSIEGMKQTLDTPSPEPTPVEDSGYSIWDVGVVTRQGGAAITKGALGLPVNAANLIAAPFMDSPFQQPEFVRDMRGIIDEQQQEIYDQQASDKLKGKDQEFQKADNLWEVSKFAVTNPGWLGLQAFQQGPQVLASGPGGVLQRVLTGAVNAAGQSEEAVATELRKQGLSEEEIAKRSASAFAESFALNSVVPYATGGTFLEGLGNRLLRQRVVDSVGKDVLAKVGKETAESIITEVGDQYIQNIHSGKAADEGLAHAGVLGAFFSLAAAGPTATIQSAAEAGRTASRLQAHLLEKRTNKTTSEPVAPDNSLSADFLKMTQGELFGEGGKAEPATTATPVEEADAVNQWQLRTKAATIRTQLAKDRSALSALQQRIERAPFAEEAADLLTNQERGDMRRLQARIPIQEQRLAEIESATVPIQSSLPLGEKRQPKNPKFRGDERTVDQIKSDYFKTQPVQGPAPMPPELRKEAQRTKVEELKRSKKEVTDADKKAKAQYEAARRKYLDGVRAGLMDLDPDTRASRLAEAAVTWKINNPLVLPSKQAATTTTTPAQSQAAAPVEGEATVPVSTLDDTLKNAPESSVALPNATPQGGTGVTLDDVSRAVGGGKRDRLASRLSYMIQDGNLDIVQDQSEIPGDIGRMQEQGKGWYDTKTGKTYLVASNLNSKNIKGDILATLAHETKHGGDFGGSKGLARSFVGFIGKEANARMGAKIREAATKGDKSAKYAVGRIDNEYQGLGLNEDQLASELAANYISAEAKKTGIGTSLYRGIVSPLRVGAKKLLRSNDVSLGDIHYMADALVGEVANRGERINPSTGVALPMVLGFSANNFQAAQDAGRVFQSENGNYKFVISDKGSTLQQGASERLAQGETLPLGETLNHPELYDNYVGLPQAIDVKVDPTLKGSATAGYWNRNKFTVYVSPESVNNAAADPDTFRGLILHEVQHAIQDVEGHPRGGNSDMFKNTPEYTRAKTSRDNTRRLTSALLQGIVHPKISPVANSIPANTMATINKLVDDAKKNKDNLAGNAQMVAVLLEEGILTPQTLSVINKLNELGTKLALADNVVLTKDSEAFDKYWNLYGEEEARFTQDNRNASLEELPINPEETMGYGKTATYGDNDSYLPLAERAHGMAAMPSIAEDASAPTLPERPMAAASMPSVSRVRQVKPEDFTEGQTYPLDLTGDGREWTFTGKVRPDEDTPRDTLLAFTAPVDSGGTPTTKWVTLEDLEDYLPNAVEQASPMPSVVDSFTARREKQLNDEEEAFSDQLFTDLRNMGINEDLDKLEALQPKIDKFISLLNTARKLDDAGFYSLGYKGFGMRQFENRMESIQKNIDNVNGVVDEDNHTKVANTLGLARSNLEHIMKEMDGELEAYLEYSAQHRTELNMRSKYDRDMAQRYDSVISKPAAIKPKTKPMPSIKDSTEDGDRRSWWGKKKDGNKYVRSISNVLSSSQGYGEQVFQMLSDRGGARIVLAYQAERLAADMRDGVVAAAGAQGVTNKVINDQLRAKIDEINALPSKESRDIAIKNLDKKYPGVGTALIGLRELKWSLARAVIAQRRAEGRDLTLKEHNIINRMLENQETWTTRIYESGQLNSEDLANRKLARIKANPTSEEAVQFAEDVKTLFTKYVKIPSEDVLLTMKPKDLRRYYATWKGDPDGVAQDVMVKELTKLAKKPDKAFEDKLLAVRDELMGRSKAKTSTVRGFAGARQNRTVLEGREKVPPEIRRLMGEITDPVAREVLSVARLSSLYTQNQLLQKLADTTQGSLWQDHSTGDFSQEIKGENYGPMRGKFVTPAGLRVIQPVVDMSMETDDAIVNINEDGTVAIGRAFATTANGVQKAAGATKLVSLIWNLGAAGMNYVGAYGALMSNGIGFSKIKDAQVLTIKAIRARYQPNLYTGETQKNIEELLIGNVMDSATTGEYQQRLFSTIFKDMDKDATPEDVKRKVKELLRTGVLVSKDIYAFADMWAKVAAWQGRVDYLTELYKVEGTNKSRNDILREAGHDITAANISWSRAPIAVKAVEKYLGPLAMFFVYFAEVPRSTAYSLALAQKDIARMKDLKTPEGKALARDAGIRRLVGTMGYIAAISGTMAWYLNGMEDDEERRRKTDPEWEQKGFNLPVGMTKDGKLITYNFLRGDFIGPLNEVLVKLATQDDDDTTAKIMKEYITDQFVKNRILFSFMRLSKSLLGLETENFDDNAGELADRLDQLSWGDDNNLGRNLMDFVEKASPATPRGIVKTANGSVGDGYSFDPATNPAVAIIQSLGLRPSVRDPEKSLTFAASRYNKAKTEATDDLTTLKKRYSKMDAAAVINKLEDIIQDEREAFKDIYEVYDGTVAFNGYYTDKDYAKAAADVIESKKLGKVGSDLKSGAFNPRFIPENLPSKWREARLEYIKTLPTEKKSKASADLRVEYAALKDYLNSRSK